jgi:hypothetical protein
LGKGGNRPGAARCGVTFRRFPNDDPINDGGARPPAHRRSQRASDAARCAREAERLLAKSDEELARLGLRRDEVVRHAFARFMYI